jgi:uncharacterized protein DUF2631
MATLLGSRNRHGSGCPATVCDDIAVAVTDQHSADQHSADQTSNHGADPYSGVDPSWEPSADWGWHGTFPLAGPLAGWFTAIALFAMLIGNHRSHVEDIFLIGLGTLLVVMLLAGHLKARKAKRR